MPVTCRHCKKAYSNQGNLNRHLREKHELNSEVISYDKNVKSFKCLEGCNVSFSLHAELVQHLKDNHNFEVQQEEREFASMEDFLLWLQQLQNTDDVEYINPRGKALNHNKDSVIYYSCNRSGKTRDISKTNERLKKTQGSKKIDFSCTSQMKLVVNKLNSSVAMIFFKTHYGHNCKIQHLRLPREERINIAQKLTIGVNMTKILDTNRENFDKAKLKRMDLLTRKDIRNIKSAYNIQLQEGVRHSEDAVSVDMYVQECYQSESNPVLFYKPQNVDDDCHILEKEDFCIIIMNTSQKDMLMRFGHNIIAVDSTHGLNSYDFELTTVLVVDDWGEGFPGACMLTNRKDSFIFNFFFQKLKENVGILKPNTFMTDITNVFYNPWKNVMGNVSAPLYCAWHIDRAWQSNINKINDPEKRKMVYHTLKLLQTSTNKEDFHKIMSNFVTEMLEDHGTINFGLYFRNNYEHTYEKWAYCYRQNSGINTNMRLESMHKIIKYIYLDGKKIKRLDKGLYALNKYIRDKIVDRILKKVKGKNSSHIQNIHNRHKSAVSGNFEVTKEENDKWTIITMSHSSKINLNYYKVSKTSLIEPCCHLTCALCKICVHSYVCTCPDFFIHNTICKHIHYIALKKNDAPIGLCENNVNTENCEITQHLKTLTQENNNTKNRENLLQNVVMQTIKLEKNIKHVQDTELLKHVVKTLKTENILIESNFKKIQKFDGEVNKEPANKNTEKQLSFHSTKKRKISQKHLSRPNLDEMEDLRNTFLNPNTEYISTNSENDHNYL